MDSYPVQRDIRYLNFAALRDAGYRGVIFDKDNCLVSTLSPSLRRCAYHAPRGL
jgi:predicted HAD superfamily phosphohydrolase YqeG